MKVYKNSKILKNIYVLVSILIVICVNTFVQSENNMPITVDEIGYLSYPATIAGYKWNEAFNYIPYYGFGYGLLLLPLFLFCRTIEQIYIGVKIFNYILVAIIFLFIKLFGEKICENENSDSLIYSLLCCVIPSILVFKNYALSELIIIAVYFIVIFALDKYIKTGEVKYKLLCLILNIYLLSIHLRTVGVVITSLVIFLFYDIKHGKVHNKNNKPFKTIIIVIIIISIFLLTNYLTKLSGIGNVNDINSISGQIKRIQSLFHPNELKNFILLMISKIWTYLTSYMGFILIGIGKLFYDILKNANDNKIPYMHIYLLVSFVLEFSINCIAMSGVGRLDMIFYTRYSEFCAIPIFYIGIKQVWENKLKFKNIFIISIFMICTYWAIYALLQDNKSVSYFLTLCVPNVSIWWNNGEFLGLLATKVSIIFLLGFCFVAKVKSKLIKSIPYILMVYLWVCSSKNSIENYEITLRIQNYGFIDEVQFIKNNKFHKVYAVVDTDTWEGTYYECWLQLAIPDIEVICISKNANWLSIEDPEVIIIVPSQVIEEDINRYKDFVLSSTDYFYLIGH